VSEVLVGVGDGVPMATKKSDDACGAALLRSAYDRSVRAEPASVMGMSSSSVAINQLLGVAANSVSLFFRSRVEAQLAKHIMSLRQGCSLLYTLYIPKPLQTYDGLPRNWRNGKRRARSN
jgi:hypothetical protein